MRRIIFPVVMAGFLVGCGNNGVDDYSVNTSDDIGSYTVFDSSNGDIPYPNDILYAPNSSTTNDPGDGTLNIPYEAVDSDAAIKSALNTLDGFSTISPISVGLSAPVDPTTLPGHVRLFTVLSGASPATNYVPAVGAITGELTFGVDFVATVNGERLVILPLKPLASHAGYMVVLTDGIETADGKALAPDLVTEMLNGTRALVDGEGNPTIYYDPSAAANTATAQSLEGLRQLTQARHAQLIGQDGMDCNATAEGVACENVIMSWSFTTQTIGAVQDDLAAAATGDHLAFIPTGKTTADIGLNGIADIYVGTVPSTPQYLPQPTEANPTAPLTGTFSYDTEGHPVIEANVTIPLIATLPNGALGCSEPTAGWPVVIYQHGITRQRTDMLAYAETFAAPPLCAATIAIDLPMHGVTETNASVDPLAAFYMPTLERTYDLDVATESYIDGYGYAIDSYVPDGVIDSTGAHYMNLASLLTTRDYMRQTTSDLLWLEHSVGTVLTAGDPVKLDPANVHFVAHSLGTIASIGYLSETGGLVTSTLAMPGQGVIQLLNNSAVFGPSIHAGLAANGIYQDTPEYDSFMIAAQTLVDDVDPANYALGLAADSAKKMLFFEAVGDGTEGSGDQHIPNAIATAPLSGTDPFLSLVGAEDINTTSSPYAAGAKTVTRLTEGEHRSPLDPQYSAEATTEIHTQMATFIGSDGNFIVITDPLIIE